mmetsp:Transcript_4857/g.11588  ORF Transcript_4857/g.11588 Transcript_4857/m.11588 type:complete len:272 (-) Transcript_4857:415-1230(-)
MNRYGMNHSLFFACSEEISFSRSLASFRNAFARLNASSSSLSASVISNLAFRLSVRIFCLRSRCFFTSTASLSLCCRISILSASSSVAAVSSGDIGANLMSSSSSPSWSTLFTSFGSTTSPWSLSAAEIGRDEPFRGSSTEPRLPPPKKSESMSTFVSPGLTTCSLSKLVLFMLRTGMVFELLVTFPLSPIFIFISSASSSSSLLSRESMSTVLCFISGALICWLESSAPNMSSNSPVMIFRGPSSSSWTTSPMSSAASFLFFSSSTSPLT